MQSGPEGPKRAVCTARAASTRRLMSAEDSAGAAREDCARQERDELLNKVYGGAAGDLIAAFLKETHISADEAARLRKLLDEMEV